MPIECAKLELPVVTSGCKLAYQKDGENIFPMSLIKPEVTTGSCNLAHWFAVELLTFVVTMPIERAKLQLPVVTSGFN